MQHIRAQIVTILLIGTIIANPAYATCPNAINIKKGDKVTDCDRIGYSREYDKKVRHQLIDAEFDKKRLDVTKKQVIELKDLMVVKTERANFAEDAMVRARKERDKERARNQTVFFIGMGVGIGLVTLAAYILGQATK